LVIANQRSGCLRSIFPACAEEIAVSWWTMTSGLAAATASPTEAASSPSITTPSAPIRSSRPSLASLVVVPVT